jgi:tRNA-Thr(GGU) m(6)t(6)A37 methyltransferase TsaA
MTPQPPPEHDIRLTPIGRVESPLTNPAAAPKQGHEGAPEAWLVFEPGVLAGLEDLRAGDEIIVLTWLHRADRDVLRVRPRDDLSNPMTGVFSTRSADRPNPIGLHRAQIVSIEGVRLRVRNLEAVDGTPIVDVKPPLRLPSRGPQRGDLR